MEKGGFPVLEHLALRGFLLPTSTLDLSGISPSRGLLKLIISTDDTADLYSLFKTCFSVKSLQTLDIAVMRALHTHSWLRLAPLTTGIRELQIHVVEWEGHQEGHGFPVVDAGNLEHLALQGFCQGSCNIFSSFAKVPPLKSLALDRIRVGSFSRSESSFAFHQLSSIFRSLRRLVLNMEVRLQALLTSFEGDWPNLQEFDLVVQIHGGRITRLAILIERMPVLQNLSLVIRFTGVSYHEEEELFFQALERKKFLKFLNLSYPGSDIVRNGRKLEDRLTKLQYRLEVNNGMKFYPIMMVNASIEVRSEGSRQKSPWLVSDDWSFMERTNWFNPPLPNF